LPFAGIGFTEVIDTSFSQPAICIREATSLTLRKTLALGVLRRTFGFTWAYVGADTAFSIGTAFLSPTLFPGKTLLADGVHTDIPSKTIFVTGATSGAFRAFTRFFLGTFTITGTRGWVLTYRPEWTVLIIPA